MITQKLDNFMIWVGTQIFFGKTALEHLPEGTIRISDEKPAIRREPSDKF